MPFSKQKSVTLTAGDFVDRGALYHAEFSAADGSPCLVQVVPDPDAESPREWDNLWTWATTPGAGYGDIKPDFQKEARKGYCQKHFYRPEDFHGETGGLDREFKKAHLIVPLYLYRHSGDVISAGGYGAAWPDKQWDSGCMGFAFVSREKVKAEFNCKRVTKRIRARALDCLEGEVQAMNAVNFGLVYGIKVTNLETEEEDSCWGFVCPDTGELGRCVADMLSGWLEGDGRRGVAEALLRGEH